MPATDPPAEPGHPRHIWVLASYRAGENSQLIALAEALDLPFEIKSLAYHRTASLPGLLRLRTLTGIDRQLSADIEPPWPDLVLTAGLRNEPVARWIRQHSGSHSRIVFLGRSWAAPRRFDLVVTTPQYRLPPHPNILHNHTTMQRVTPTLLDQAARQWLAATDETPQRPITAVILGGSSGPYRFAAGAATALALRLNRLVQQQGGTLLISSSSRTPPEAVSTLRNALSVPSQLYEWRPDDPDNPYFAWLGAADQIIVTSDSIAMLSEACATTKPVFCFDLSGQHPANDTRPFQRDWNLKSRAYRLLMYGPKRLSRDLSLVHQHLIADGRLRWLGESFPKQIPPPLDEVEKTAAAVRQMLKPPD